MLQRLSVLPPSAEVAELVSRAEGYLREAETWCTSVPSPVTRETVMKKILALHVVLARIERAHRT